MNISQNQSQYKGESKAIDLLPKGAALLSTSLLILFVKFCIFVVELCVHPAKAQIYSLCECGSLSFSSKHCHQVFSFPIVSHQNVLKGSSRDIFHVFHGIPWFSQFREIQTPEDTSSSHRSSQALESRNTVTPPRRGALDG
jgi:hypothetical protein